jgi:hypothetical protein
MVRRFIGRSNALLWRQLDETLDAASLMPIPKTLIISATPPGKAGTGEALLREICLAFPKDTISFFVLESLNYALPGDTNDIKDMSIKRVKLPTELLRPSSKLPILKEISLRKKRQNYWREVELVKQRAIEFGKQQGCKQVFAVLASPTVTVIAEAVAKALDAELICLAWDPHETTMQLLQFDESTKEKVMSQFAACVKRAKTLAVASDGMSTEYKARYAVEGITLIRPVRDTDTKKERSLAPDQNDRQIVIGFSGSLYAQDEFKSLFEALSSVQWKVAGRQVTLKVLSNYFYIPAQFDQQHSSIQLLGFRDQESVIEELSKCHFAYLPYWFDESRSLSVRTCFPDKLGTYLTSGVPVLFHGPKASTPTDFFAKYPIGLTCHSLEHRDILDSISRLVTDLEFRNLAWQARNQALESEYSLLSFRSQIAKLLDVPPNELNHPL